MFYNPSCHAGCWNLSSNKTSTCSCYRSRSQNVITVRLWTCQYKRNLLVTNLPTSLQQCLFNGCDVIFDVYFMHMPPGINFSEILIMTKKFHSSNVFENIFCKMSAILFPPPCIPPVMMQNLAQFPMLWCTSVNLARTRLLHNPSLVAVGMSVGYQMWPLIG